MRAIGSGKRILTMFPFAGIAPAHQWALYTQRVGATAMASSRNFKGAGVGTLREVVGASFESNQAEGSAKRPFYGNESENP